MAVGYSTTLFRQSKAQYRLTDAAHHGILLPYHQVRQPIQVPDYLITAEFRGLPRLGNFFSVRLGSPYTHFKMAVALAVWQVKTRFFTFFLLNISTGA